MNVYTKYTLNACIPLFLIACQAEEIPPTVSNIDTTDFSITATELDAHARLQGIADAGSTRGARARRTYIERNAMAEKIMAGNSGDEEWLAMVNAEVKYRRNEIIISRYVDQQIEKAASDTEVETFYNDHIDDYSVSEVFVALILVPSLASNDIQMHAEKGALAGKISENLRLGNDATFGFEDRADEITRLNEPDEPITLQRDRFDSNMVDTVMTMSVGDVSGPIETNKGFYIVKLVEKNILESTPLEDVKDKIAYKLKYDAKLKVLERLKNDTISRVRNDIEEMI